MASNGKTYRITKVARVLNISWKHLVDHLLEKGFEVESKITAKITQEMYDVLAKEYQSDRKARAEAEALEINIRKEKETLTADLQSHPTGKVPGKEYEETVFIKDTGFSNKPKEEAPKPEVKEETKPEPVAPVTPPTPPVVEKEEKTPEEEKAQEAPKKGPKVVGKIDLKPKKVVKPAEPVVETPAPVVEDKPVAEEPVAEKPVEKPLAEKPEVETPKVEAGKVEAVEEKPGDKTPAAEDAPATEEGAGLKKTVYSKLGGLKIKGKIELPKEPVRKSVKKACPL